MPRSRVDHHAPRAGISTNVLAANPFRPGNQSIVAVPTNKTIPALSHRDDRMAIAVSGPWRPGYGDRFAANVVKCAARMDSEAGAAATWRTGGAPVLLPIAGIGPQTLSRSQFVGDTESRRKQGPRPPLGRMSADAHERVTIPCTITTRRRRESGRRPPAHCRTRRAPVRPQRRGRARRES